MTWPLDYNVEIYKIAYSIKEAEISFKIYDLCELQFEHLDVDGDLAIREALEIKDTSHGWAGSDGWLRDLPANEICRAIIGVNKLMPGGSRASFIIRTRPPSSPLKTLTDQVWSSND